MQNPRAGSLWRFFPQNRFPALAVLSTESHAPNRNTGSILRLPLKGIKCSYRIVLFCQSALAPIEPYLYCQSSAKSVLTMPDLLDRSLMGDIHGLSTKDPSVCRTLLTFLIFLCFSEACNSLLIQETTLFWSGYTCCSSQLMWKICLFAGKTLTSA